MEFIDIKSSGLMTKEFGGTAKNIKTHDFYRELAKRTATWSGSFIKQLVEGATRLAVDAGRVKRKHFGEAYDAIARQQKDSWVGYQNELKRLGE